MNKFYTRLLVLLILLFGIKSLQSQCTFTTTVPYFQNFVGLSATNPLPNCWARTSSVTCLTYSAAAMAGFYTAPTGTNYFYTNGIYLDAGVVYSVSLNYYTTAASNALNWSDFSMHLSSSQNSVSMTPLVSAASPVITLGNTTLGTSFTVVTPGIYYVCIRGISVSSCCSYSLYFDDFAITKPCNLNVVNTTIAPSTTFVCLGDTISLNASGANTYSWSGGNTTASYTTVPNGNTTYYVTGTSTLTGCSNTASLYLSVNPRPVMSIFTSTNQSCAGSSLTLTGYGNAQYYWSTGSNNTNISVTPTTTTTYYLTGLNNFGCTATTSLQILVHPLPTITAVSSKSVSCVGEEITLTAGGAKTYAWTSLNASGVGSSIPFTPTANTTFTVVGTDSMGCVNSNILYLSVNACTGLKSIQLQNSLLLYPNPGAGIYTLADLNGSANLEVLDANGRQVLVKENAVNGDVLDIQHLSNGLYFVKFRDNSGLNLIKLIKLN